MENLGRFLDKWASKYPKLANMFASQEGLFEFYRFPSSIHRSVYTSNLIENNNKGLKHHAKLKEQFPNEASLERFVCTYYVSVKSSGVSPPKQKGQPSLADH